MRILVTGGSGYLGSSLLRYLNAERPGYPLFTTYLSNPPPLDFPSLFRLDLRDLDSIAQVVRSSQPQLIVHTAAQMKGSLEDMRLVNAIASGFLGTLAKESRARMIHISTDQVFDGRQGSYREEDPPNPITDYAISKFEAEEAVRKSGAAAMIVRTSLIYGLAPPDSRTRAMLRGDMPRLFTDEQRCPIWVETLCAALLELCEEEVTGILHVAGAQALNRYEFGVKLVNALGGDTHLLIPSRLAESGLIRPPSCTLDCSKARVMLKTKLIGVDEVLDLGIY